MRRATPLFLALAFSLSATAQRSLNLRLNIGQFSGDTSTTMVQIFLDVPSGGLTYAGGTGAATVRFHADLAQSGVRQVDEDWTMHVPKYNGGSERSVLGVHTLFARPGMYTLTVVAYDSAAPATRDSIAIPYAVRDLNARRVQFSSLELGRTFRRAAANEVSSFIKGGIEILPNVTETYTDGGLLLSYYAELYHLDLVPENGAISVEASIYDGSGNMVYRRNMPVKRGVRAIAVAESLSVDALTSGVYRLYLRAAVGNASGGIDTVYTRREFTVNNSAMPPLADPYNAPDFASSDFAGRAEAGLDSLFQLFSYVATDQEKATYAQLKGPEAKGAFLFAFWQTGPRGVGQYTLRTYYDAVERANSEFKTMYKQGWKTDRGRVLLQYGPYTRIDRHLFEVDSKPYYVWYYDEIEGGVQFYFVDISGFGDFKLVHSTARNETRDEMWYDHYAKGLMKGQ